MFERNLKAIEIFATEKVKNHRELKMVKPYQENFVKMHMLVLVERVYPHSYLFEGEPTLIVLAPTLLHSRPQRRIDSCACGWQTRYQWEVRIIDLVGDIPTAQGGGVGVVFSSGDHYPYVGSFLDIAHPVGADHIPVGFIFALRELSFHLTSSIIGEN